MLPLISLVTSGFLEVTSVPPWLVNCPRGFQQAHSGWRITLGGFNKPTQAGELPRGFQHPVSCLSHSPLLAYTPLALLESVWLPQVASRSLQVASGCLRIPSGCHKNPSGCLKLPQHLLRLPQEPLRIPQVASGSPQVASRFPQVASGSP